jgi:hypothetical protein
MISTPSNEDQAIHYPELDQPPPYVWDGVINQLPTNTTELRNWLGIDGTVSADIGDNSHMWLMEDTTTEDIGTLGNTDSSLTGSGVTNTTHADIISGTKNLVNFNSLTDFMSSPVDVDIPTDKDGGNFGGKSFVVGIVFRYLNNGGNTQTKSVMNCKVGSGNGWDMQLRGSISWNRFNVKWQFADITLQNTFSQRANGDNWFLIVNMNFATNIISFLEPIGSARSFVSDPLDQGSFLGSAPIRIGAALTAAGSFGSPDMYVAQAFSFEYDGTFDSEITIANAERFTKKLAGDL